MKKLSSLFASILIASSFLAACGGGNEQAEEQEQPATEEPNEEVEALELFTTIFPLEDFATKIGGEFVNVTNIVPVGADAHTFEPTAREMISVAEGDAFIYNGAGLEGFVDALIETLEGEEVAIVKASEGIDFIDYDHDHSQDHDHDHAHDDHGHEDDHDHDHAHDDHAHEEEDEHDHDHAHDDHAHEDDHDHDHAHDDHAHEEEDDHGHEHDDHAHEEDDHDHGHDDHAHDHDEDPHVWLDPILSITLAENIKNALVELMPEQEEVFNANFEEVKAELEAIDAEFQAMVEAAEKDTFLVSHAGYGYWEERYGVKQIGIAGISPTNEPSQRQLQDIIELANEYGLQYVLFEQNIPTKVAEVVKDEVGAEALYLHNLEALIEEDVENDEDYFSLMRRNIEVLETALQ
ncbi:metal ABC transporter solute-binding protein, Zn/Mn family [Halalkalibacter alkaliphilus]|uniref:Zinc ABC transporter substrate-binding protein n=1 Tax=Halalkalibacter alkaliphilus TaxID=2917993 RepID=A0A9X2A3P9_9BACI|nr:zinc ABC transporter substrate-binding protein [Halalkalibacter alkaliphilus]MCL7746168.1 zinc ABC transporter substrate-binding protein [Halalkalibacter alkaliphilus]